jgi:hypothetical protein
MVSLLAGPGPQDPGPGLPAIAHDRNGDTTWGDCVQILAITDVSMPVNTTVLTVYSRDSFLNSDAELGWITAKRVTFLAFSTLQTSNH